MIKSVHLIFMVLASFRLVEIFNQDRITEGLRKRFPHYLWTCVRCLSVWAGGIAAGLFVLFPWANWPLAISWIYFVHSSWILEKNKGKVVVTPLADGRLDIRGHSLNGQGVEFLLNRALNTLQEQKQPAVREVVKAAAK